MAGLDPWVAGLALVLVELARSVPALARVLARRSSDAVSPENLGIYLGTGAGWVVLAAMVSAWWVVGATSLWLVLQAAICVAVVRVSPSKRRRVVAATAGSAVFVVAAATVLAVPMGLAGALGLVLGLCTAAAGVGALREGLTSATTQGLSITTLAIN